MAWLDQLVSWAGLVELGSTWSTRSAGPWRELGRPGRCARLDNLVTWVGLVTRGDGSMDSAPVGASGHACTSRCRRRGAAGEPVGAVNRRVEGYARTWSTKRAWRRDDVVLRRFRWCTHTLTKRAASSDDVVLRRFRWCTHTLHKTSCKQRWRGVASPGLLARLLDPLYCTS